MESRGDVPFHRTLRFKLLLAIVGSLGILSLFLIQYGYSVARDALVEGTIEDLKQSTQLATNELQSTLDFYDRGILDRPEALEIIDRNLAGEIRQIRIRLDVEELDQVQRLFPEIFRRGELDWIDPVIQDMDNASEFPGINRRAGSWQPGGALSLQG